MCRSPNSNSKSIDFKNQENKSKEAGEKRNKIKNLEQTDVYKSSKLFKEY